MLHTFLFFLLQGVGRETQVLKQVTPVHLLYRDERLQLDCTVTPAHTNENTIYFSMNGKPYFINDFPEWIISSDRKQEPRIATLHVTDSAKGLKNVTE